MIARFFLLTLLIPALSAGEWVWDQASHCTWREEGGVLFFRLARAEKLDALVGRSIKQVEPGKEVEFSAEITAPQRRMVCLQAKLYRSGKELRRVSSEWNRSREEAMTLRFNTGEADRIELLFRIPKAEANLGREATAKAFYFGPPRPAATAPRLEITPGYQSCAVSLNHCKAVDYPEISGELFYRPAGDAEWVAAPAPVLIRHEKSLRASLLDLEEDRGYELKLTVNDKGEREEFIRSFRTLGAELPIAKTIQITSSAPFNPESGTPSGYVRYTAPSGFVFDPGKQPEEAILIDGGSYIILDGLTVRGGKKHGVSILDSDHIVVRNCDISDYGRRGEFRPADGRYYDGKWAVAHDAGIRIEGSRHILADRNFIHDPKSPGTSWHYSHPAGATGFLVGDSVSVTLRYNDVIGSDLKRWNDGCDGKDNFSPAGGFRQDGEIYGNYFAFGDDDGLELDGGQRNARFFRNLVEGFYCGISLAPCLSGPSYVYRNEFRNPGDELGLAGSGIKMISGLSVPWGTVFLWNNIVNWTGGVSWPPLPESPGEVLLLLHARGNRFAVKEPYAGHNAALSRIDLDDTKPPEPEDLPFRPAGFRTDRNQIRFAQTDDRIQTELLTVTVTQVGFRSEFRIVSPEGSKHFRVTPVSGVLEYGTPLTLTISSNPAGIKEARRNVGAFAIRLADGFSRPVSVETDTRRHFELFKQARAGAVYGTIEANELSFDLPEEGEYFLFVKCREGSSTRARVALDGGEFEDRSLSAPLYTENPWRNVAEMRTLQQNRPYRLSTGRHTFRVAQQPGMKQPNYAACVLTRNPNGFLYAPDDL